MSWLCFPAGTNAMEDRDATRPQHMLGINSCTKSPTYFPVNKRLCIKNKAVAMRDQKSLFQREVL